MNSTVDRCTLWMYSVALALIFILVLPADTYAIGLYSVIARAAEADIRLVVLIPEENASLEYGGASNRIRFLCNVNYRLPGDETGGKLERRGLIVTDRFIGLVTVKGNATGKVSISTNAGTDTPRPVLDLRRTVDNRIRRHITMTARCMKTIAVIARHLIAHYAL